MDSTRAPPGAEIPWIGPRPAEGTIYPCLCGENGGYFLGLQNPLISISPRSVLFASTLLFLLDRLGFGWRF